LFRVGRLELRFFFTAAETGGALTDPAKIAAVMAKHGLVAAPNAQRLNSRGSARPGRFQ
jgi:hypothetical protein